MDTPSNMAIPRVEREVVDHYFKTIVSFSHMMGSITGIVSDYITSAFGKGYIKTIWNTLEEPFSQRSKGFRDLMLKPRPIMIINPKFDPSEEADFRPISEFDNEVANDPRDDIQFGLRGAQLLTERENFQLWFRMRRYTMSFEISFIFDSDAQRIQCQRYIRDNIRHRMHITTRRYVENYLPAEYMQAIADMNQMDIKSPEFEEFLNITSGAPIRYRYRTGSGNDEFFATLATPIQMLFQEGPSSNGPVKRGNIVVSSSFSENLEVEFVAASTYFLRTNVNIGDPILHYPGLSDGEFSVDATMKTVAVDNFFSMEIPVGEDVVGNYSKYRNIHVQADKPGDDQLNLKEHINETEVLNMIDFYTQHGKPIDFVQVLVYEDLNQVDPERLVYNSNTLDLMIRDMTIYTDYHVIIYIDRVKINEIKDQLFKTDQS